MFSASAAQPYAHDLDPHILPKCFLSAQSQHYPLTAKDLEHQIIPKGILSDAVAVAVA